MQDNNESKTVFPGDFLPQERQRLILERLAQEGRVVAQELARQFGTSEDTIRRDLRELAAAGQCQRVYGGALPRSPATGSLNERVASQPEAKLALGQQLAKLLPAGSVVFVDAGSTNLAAVRALPEEISLTLITNAPMIAAEAAVYQGIELIVIGGAVDRASGAALGLHALHDVADLRPDLFLLGTCALDPVAGIAAFGFDDAEFKRALVARSQRVISAVSTDKLGTRAPFQVAPLEKIADLVLEADAPAEQIEAIRQAGVIVHLADSASKPS